MQRVRRDPRGSARIDYAAGETDLGHARYESRLAERFGVPVTVEYAKDGAGRLILDFADLDIPDGLLERFGYRDDAG